MKFLPLAIVTFLFAHLSYAQSIEEAYNTRFENAELTSISEQLYGLTENQAHRLILTSDSTSREGLFFILKVSQAEKISSIRIDYITTESIEPNSELFTLTDKDIKKWIYLGLTGDVWKNKELDILAWKIDLINAEGDVVDEWKSFLWEKDS